MLRSPRTDDQLLEALLEERDTLRIRLSLALDSRAPDAEQVRALLDAIADTESRIKSFYPSP